MRLMPGILAVVTILGLTTAAAAQPCCLNQSASGYGAYEAYSAPACGAPCYGLVPGCCEFSPSCCDHVWDGYCQELRGLDAVRALMPRRGCRGCGAGVCSSGAGCGPVAASGYYPAEQAPPAAEGTVEIPTAPRRDQ